VGGGQRGGGAGGRGVDGCCINDKEKNIANYYYVHTNILKYDIFM
jgi:hypothetical protein